MGITGSRRIALGPAGATGTNPQTPSPQNQTGGMTIIADFAARTRKSLAISPCGCGGNPVFSGLPRFWDRLYLASHLVFSVILFVPAMMGLAVGLVISRGPAMLLLPPLA